VNGLETDAAAWEELLIEEERKQASGGTGGSDGNP
jgi:hypothetical protein